MILDALNERHAAYTGEPSGEPGDPRKALNQLLTVDSWGKLVKFLKSPLCMSILPSRESEPLTWTFNPGPMPGHNTIRLSGSLGRSISRDPDIDDLDDLAQGDLLAEPTLREVWIPEVLDFITEARKFLTLAAVALGSPIPGDFYGDYVSRVGDPGRALDANPPRLVSPDGIGAIAINPKYVPDMRLLIEDFYLVDLYPDINRLGEMAAYNLDLTADDVIAFHDWVEGSGDLKVPENPSALRIYYDIRPHSEVDAVRRLAGDVIADYLNHSVEELEGWPYSHHFHDDPSYEECGVRYVPGEGFVKPHPAWRPRWANELWKVAIDAVYDGRIVLCEWCQTPIVYKLESRKPDYCCPSHKVLANKRRRERAIALCASDTPLDEAAEIIGPKYRKSIERWYDDAKELAITPEGRDA